MSMELVPVILTLLIMGAFTVRVMILFIYATHGSSPEARRRAWKWITRGMFVGAIAACLMSFRWNLRVQNALTPYLFPLFCVGIVSAFFALDACHLHDR
jgi:hypothetical protein